jgi:hypothetical protein
MNDIDPKIWGPHYWKMYHYYASSYPINPTPIVMDSARAFIKIIPYTLPCTSCTDHAFAFIKHYTRQDSNLNMIVSTRSKMEKFFSDFHNNVNSRLGIR